MRFFGMSIHIVLPPPPLFSFSYFHCSSVYNFTINNVLFLFSLILSLSLSHTLNPETFDHCSTFSFFFFSFFSPLPSYHVHRRIFSPAFFFFIYIPRSQIVFRLRFFFSWITLLFFPGAQRRTDFRCFKSSWRGLTASSVRGFFEVWGFFEL